MHIHKIKISAISYLNTLPFLYGIKNSGLLKDFVFQLEYPSISAKKLIDNEVDIALIPVAAIPKVKQVQLISDFCIGAYKEVKSVLLLSDVPLEKIKSILLDYQSQTSIHLVQILAGKFWNISPEWINAKKDFENTITGQTAGVVIGDRTFSLYKKHPFVYDLSLEWFKFTGLPFVFATWVSNKNIPAEFKEQFNQALRFGIQHINEVVDDFNRQNPDSEIDLYDYLKNNLSFQFDDEKKKSLMQFYQYLAEMQLINEEELKRIQF